MESPPLRSFDNIRPLITAAEGFPVLERLALEATEHLWLSFRIFDPNTRLRMATDIGDTWMDLLRHRLTEGVKLRVLISDFDPIVGPDLHEGSIRSAAALCTLRDDGDIETMVVRHEARVGKGIRFGLWIPAARALEQHRKEMNGMTADDRADAFAHRSGIWRYLRVRKDGKIGWRSPRLPRLFPATFHQKIAVADHRSSVIGGLDIDERRYDDPAHDREACETWHDVALHVTGDVVTDISRHIAACWNDNRLRVKALRREQSRHAPPVAADLTSPLNPLKAPGFPQNSGKSENIRLLRTLSGSKRRVGLQFSPDTLVCEIEQAHIDAINRACHAIYIETQFFRSRTIAESMADAARNNPDLNLVMILPAAPELIAFEEKLRLPERMGEFLQSDCLDMVNDAFGPRATILSPVRPVASASEGRDQLHGAEIIYLHSKVLISDDTRFVVGSANLNGRSMNWDTEAAIECRNTQAVNDLRQAVLQHWFRDVFDPSVFELQGMAGTWARLAWDNAKQTPNKRRCFLVPYDKEPAEKVGMPVPAIPNELV